MTVYWQQSNAHTLPPASLTTVTDVLPTIHCSPNVSTSGVIYCINSVVSEPSRQSKCVHTEGGLYSCCCCCCRTVNSRVGGESSSQHGCHRSVTLQSTVLGLWPVADSFLTESVCITGMHSGERVEWSYIGCAAQSLTQFRLADDSRENGWSIRALAVSRRFFACHFCLWGKIIHSLALSN